MSGCLLATICRLSGQASSLRNATSWPFGSRRRSARVLHLSLKRSFKIPTGVLRVTSPSRLKSKNMAFIRAVGLASDAHIDLRQKLGGFCEPLQHRQFFLAAGDVVSSVLSR